MLRMKTALVTAGMVVTVLLLLPLFCIAADIRFSASVDRDEVPLGQSLQLNLQIEGSTGIPAPELPEIDGFQVHYLGPSTMMSIVNGRMSSSVTHMYRLMPLKTGVFTIGPIHFEYKGDAYTSNSLKVQVVDNTASPSATKRRPHRGTVNLSDRVFLTIEIPKSHLYVNESIPLSIKLYMNSSTLRNIEYPEFRADWFSADDFGKPAQYQESRIGVLYDVLEFRTHIFPTRSGEFMLGPAKLKANLVTKTSRRPSSMFDDFFSRNAFEDFFGGQAVQPIELTSKQASVEVLPFPDTGRPEGFKGAVGNFDLTVSALPEAVKAGDPVTVRMTITGTGNFTSVTAPDLKPDDRFKVYDPQVSASGGDKIFEQVIIPLKDSVRDVPDITFSFLDPATGQYRTIVKKGVALKVEAPEKSEDVMILGPAASGDSTMPREQLGRDIIFLKEHPGRLKPRGAYLYNNSYFIGYHAAVLLILLFLLRYRKRKDRLSNDIGYARRLAAPRKARASMRRAERCLKDNDADAFYDTVFRTLREYLGDRFHVPSGGITADAVSELLKEKGIDHNVMQDVKELFHECDMARYAPAALSNDGMAETLQKVRQVIDHMEKQR